MNPQHERLESNPKDENHPNARVNAVELPEDAKEHTKELMNGSWAWKYQDVMNKGDWKSFSDI